MVHNIFGFSLCFFEFKSVFFLGGPTLSVASLPTSNRIAFMEMSQRFHLDHLPKVMEQALAGCQEIQSILDKAVREHLTKVGSASDWGNITVK